MVSTETTRIWTHSLCFPAGFCVQTCSFTRNLSKNIRKTMGKWVKWQRFLYNSLCFYISTIVCMLIVIFCLIYLHFFFFFQIFHQYWCFYWRLCLADILSCSSDYSQEVCSGENNSYRPHVFQSLKQSSFVLGFPSCCFSRNQILVASVKKKKRIILQQPNFCVDP